MLPVLLMLLGLLGKLQALLWSVLLSLTLYLDYWINKVRWGCPPFILLMLGKVLAEGCP